MRSGTRRICKAGGNLRAINNNKEYFCICTLTHTHFSPALLVLLLPRYISRTVLAMPKTSVKTLKPEKNIGALVTLTENLFKVYKTE